MGDFYSEGQEVALRLCASAPLIGCARPRSSCVRAVVGLKAAMEELSAVGEQVFDAECILNKRLRKVGTSAARFGRRPIPGATL